jgi:hypothetical protein
MPIGEFDLVILCDVVDLWLSGPPTGYLCLAEEAFGHEGTAL